MERVLLTHIGGRVTEIKTAPDLEMPAESLAALARICIKPTPISVDILGAAEQPEEPAAVL